MYIDKLYEKVTRDKKKLAEEYDVSISAVVYIGDNHYIVVKDGKEIRVWWEEILQTDYRF